MPHEFVDVCESFRHVGVLYAGIPPRYSKSSIRQLWRWLVSGWNSLLYQMKQVKARNLRDKDLPKVYGKSSVRE